jgi:O-antigen/teichoic acid export membrane protein
MTKNYVWRVLQTISKQGILFVITFLSAKLLSPNQFGDYSYVLAITMFAVMLGDLGISAAMTKYISENRLKENSDVKSILKTNLIFIFLISLLIVILCYVFFPFYIKDKMGSFYLISPLIILAPLTSVFDGYYRGIGNFKKLGLVNFFNGFFSVFYIYFLINENGLKGALIAQSIFYSLLLFTYFLSINFKGARIEINEGKKIVRYSLVIGLSSVAAFFYSKGDILILGEFNYFKEIGYYELILQLFTIVVLPTSIYAQVVAPAVSNILSTNKLFIYQYYLKNFKIIFSFAVLISVLFYMLSPLFFKWFLSDYYTIEMISCLHIMAFLLPTKIWGVFQTQAFIVSTGKAKLVLYTTLIGGVLNVLLDFAAISVFGFIGVFYVTLIIHSLNILIQSLYFKSYVKNI